MFIVLASLSHALSLSLSLHRLHLPRRRIVCKTVKLLTISIPLYMWFGITNYAAPELYPDTRRHCLID